MTSSTTDRIEKHIRLHAPQARVWRALSDAAEFGSWFGVELDGPFVAGQTLNGRLKPSTADRDVAQMQEKYAGMRMALYVDRVEPMRLLSFRWHPFALDTTVDYSSEPMTLVTFTLEPAGDDTLLTVVETGFDAIPIARRADAFEANEEGWTLMLGVVEKYLRAART